MNWLLIAVNVAIYLLISLSLSSQRADVNDPVLWDYLRLFAPRGLSPNELRSLLTKISAYKVFVFAHGYKPGAPELSDLFSSLFLHDINPLHLIGNMLFLWIYGDNVEHHLGRIGYLVTYLTTGVAATLFFSLFAGSSMIPLIGASGAISGVLGLYFLLFPRNKVKLFVALFPFFFDVILLPARLVLGFYILFANLLPFLTGTQSGVAYAAHIGGFLAGLVVARIGERVAWHWPWSDKFWRLGSSSKKKRVTPEQPSELLLSELRSALADNNPNWAINVMAMMDRRDLTELGTDECVLLANWLDESGHPVAATRLLHLCLANHPGAGNLADVYLLLGLMRLRQGQPTTAYQHLLSVFDYNPGPQTAERARQALTQIEIFRRKR